MAMIITHVPDQKNDEFLANLAYLNELFYDTNASYIQTGYEQGLLHPVGVESIVNAGQVGVVSVMRTIHAYQDIIETIAKCEDDEEIENILDALAVEPHSSTQVYEFNLKYSSLDRVAFYSDNWLDPQYRWSDHLLTQTTQPGLVFRTDLIQEAYTFAQKTKLSLEIDRSNQSITQQARYDHFIRALEKVLQTQPT